MIKTKRFLPKTAQFFDRIYDDGIPRNNLFILKYDVIPSIYYDHKEYFHYNLINYLKENGFSEFCELSLNSRHLSTTRKTLYINDTKEIFIEIAFDGKEDELFRLVILYNLKNGEIKKQLDLDYINKMFKRTKKKYNINLMKKDMGGLDLEEFDILIPDINLEINYGRNFAKVNEIIIRHLKTPNGSGIVLLHGDPGTGKTTYIKYLTKEISDKEIIFIPPSVAESLSDPSIIPFLMEHKNSILIIEDGEKVIANRENNGSAIAVSNLLNLTDGILGECLNIQIIVTFNMKKEKIDTALLRKGRLIAEHKFENLSVEDSNKLLEYIGKSLRVDKPSPLSDLYYIDSEDMRISNDVIKSIGFK